MIHSKPLPFDWLPQSGRGLSNMECLPLTLPSTALLDRLEENEREIREFKMSHYATVSFYRKRGGMHFDIKTLKMCQIFGTYQEIREQLAGTQDYKLKKCIFFLFHCF